MNLTQDIRFTFRTFRRAPFLVVLATVVLGLGIGATTAIFSVVYGVLLAPLRYPDANRIVAVNTVFTKNGRLIPRMTGADFVDVRDSAKALEAISYYFGGEMGVQLGDRADFSGIFWVTPRFFQVFGVAPVAGRVFAEGDEGVAAVGTAFATRNFGSPEAALRKTVRIEGRPYEVIGVLPSGFNAPRKADVWLQAPAKPENLERTAYNYTAVGKLSAGVTAEAANAEMSAIGARLASAFAVNREKSFKLVPLREQMVAQVRSTVYVLFGAVFVILLIACANVANLLLARASTRTREIAVRAAMGASRWRIARQLTIESLVLAMFGGATGVLIARFGTMALVHFAPADLPRLSDVQVDGWVLLFAVALAVVSSLVFGLAPAWHASRVDLHDSLKQGGSRGTIGGRSSQLRNALVVGEIALSFVLAIGGGLLFRSFLSLNSVDLGYRTEGILVMNAHAPAAELKDYVRVSTVMEQQLFPQLLAIPGVKSAAAAMGLPGGQYSSDGSYAVEGKHSFNALDKLPHAGFRLASPAYFATMGIPLIKGRDFTERDGFDAPFVAIISDSLAKQVFPNEDPIGRRVMCGLDSDKWMTIVGVVGDVRQQSPASKPGPELYMPLRQHPYRANEVHVAMRTAGDPTAMMEAVRKTTQRVYPEMAMQFTTMEALVADSISTPRFRMLLVGVFAALALILAMAGVYGVMSFTAAQRTSEFGLRFALGAAPSDVLQLILTRALVLAGTGLILGLALSLALSRVMAAFLFGLPATDVPTYLGVAVVTVLTTAAAALVPALRAMRIDPVIALRQD